MAVDEWINRKDEYLLKDPCSRKDKYIISNTTSCVDNLIKDIDGEIDGKYWGVKLRGIHNESGSPKLLFNSFGIDVPRLSWQNTSSNFEKTRDYLLTIILKPNHWNFIECHPNWIIQKRYPQSKKSIFKHNNIIAEKEMGKLLRKSVSSYMISTFYGLTGSKRNPWRACIFVNFTIEDTLKEFFLNSRNRGFTQIGEKFKKDIFPVFREVCRQRKIGVSELRSNYDLHKEIERNAEEKFREFNDLPRIGEGYIGETRLFNLIKILYPNAIREYSPKWLGKQRIDIYIPYKKIAIEYHGQQHYESIDFFGGEATFNKQKARDKRKSELCKLKDIEYYEWPYHKKIDFDSVKDVLNRLI